MQKIAENLSKNGDPQLDQLDETYEEILSKLDQRMETLTDESQMLMKVILQKEKHRVELFQRWETEQLYMKMLVFAGLSAGLVYLVLMKTDEELRRKIWMPHALKHNLWKKFNKGGNHDLEALNALGEELQNAHGNDSDAESETARFLAPVLDMGDH